MVENTIVGIIVGGVLVLAVRSVYRTLTGKSGSCGCGSDCPSSTPCRESAEDLAPERTLMQISAAPPDKGSQDVPHVERRRR